MTVDDDHGKDHEENMPIELLFGYFLPSETTSKMKDPNLF